MKIPTFAVRRRLGSAFLGAALSVFTLCAPLDAQNFFGSIVGTATDTSGGSIPDSKVTLTNTGTGETRSVQTDQSGNYEFVNLVPGIYKLDLEKTGFKHFTRDNIQVLVQASVRIDVQMQVGDIGQTVEVSAQAVALQTESATISQAVEGRNVRDMPLNGRNVYNLVTLVPGVITEASGAFQIGGGMANASATYVDGVPMNTGYAAQTVAAPTQDTVEEFRVQTNSASAEYGRYSGGVITLSSKSGTNEFHGTAYEFLRNKQLNANTFFSNRSGLARVPFTQNQFGATMGGPIRKNKTFFFVSYEGFYQRTATTYLLNTPTDLMRAGNFSELLTAPGGQTQIFDPLSSSNGANRAPLPGNIIPSSRLDQTAAIMSKIQWNEPNLPGITNNFINNASSGSSNDTYNGRLDNNFGDRNRLFMRFNYTAPTPVLISPYNNSEFTLGTRTNPVITAVAGDTWTISPTLIADVRASYLRNHNTRYPSQLGVDLTTIGWPAIYNVEDTTRTLPQLCVTNYDFLAGAQGGYCQGNPQSIIFVTNNVYSLSPSLTKVAGRHTIKFGAELRRIELDYHQSNNNSGNFSFTSGMTAQNALNPGNTGYALASMMLGFGAINVGTNALVLNAATTGLETYQAYYVTDTFVVNRKLTLNYGLRWEGLGAFYERDNRQTVLQPGAQNPLVANKGEVLLVGSQGYSNRGSQPYPLNLFGPRLGIAYRLTDKWVIRSGAGISFVPNDGNIGSAPYGSPVNQITTPWVPSQDGGLTPYATLSNPFPNGINQPPQRNPNYQQVLLGLAVTSAEPTNGHGYTEQYNFSVERELPGAAVLEVAYAGLRGVHLYRYPGAQLNQLPDVDLALGTQLLQQVPNPYFGLVSTGTLSAPTVAYGQLLRPFPQYTGFSNTNAADGNSSYNALQVKFEKRFGAGTLLASYTRSKLISDLEQQAAFTNGVGAYIVQDYNNLRGERSLAAYDTPNNLVISYVYDLPVGKGHSFLGNLPGPVSKLVSGWGINGISTFQSGNPLTLSVATNNTNSFGGTPRPTVIAGCNKIMSGSAQSRVNEWFNTACFVTPPAFTFGTESRTDPNLRSAGVANWDFAAVKDTTITERFVLQFRAEIFNLFNRVQFSPPNTTVGSSTYGVVTGQANNPRLVQFALRLQF
jgi:hypothetical protein